MKEIPDKYHGTLRLTVWLLNHRATADGRFKIWIDALPENFHDMPYYYTEEELENTKGNPIVYYIIAHQRLLEGFYKCVK